MNILPMDCSNDRWNKRKRRIRSWENFIGAVVFFAVIHGADGSEYASCEALLQEAVTDGNQILSATDYGTVLFDLTGGSIVDIKSAPEAVLGPFIDRGSVEEGVDLSASDLLSGFCSDIFDSLFDAYSVSTSTADCIEYLKESDLEPQNGMLEKGEYSAFLAAMTGDESYPSSFDELPIRIRNSFNDFSVDDVVKATNGADSLVRFCDRTQFTVKSTGNTQSSSTSVTPSPGSTHAPTPSGSSSSSRDTPMPTPSGTNTSNGSTSRPIPSGGSSSTSLPTPTSSKTDNTSVPTVASTTETTIVASTTAPTSGDPLDSSHTEKPTSSATGTADQTLVPTMRNTDPTISPGGATIVPTSGPGGATIVPTSGPGGATIIPTITHTIADSSGDGDTPMTTKPTPSVSFTPTTLLPTIIEGTTAPTLRPTTTSLSLKSFNTCKIGLIISDINRNDRLEPQEFVRLVNRLSGDATQTPPPYEKIDPLFRSTYEKLSDESDGEPHLDGTKPGRVPTSSQRDNILRICQKTYAAIELYEASGPTSTVSNATGSNADDAPLSETFKNQCETAMVVADLDRNDILDQEEYVRFAYRLSPDIFHRVSTFRQLDPAFKVSFEKVTSKYGITVSGSKPGQTSSTLQRQHIESVCRAAKSAIRTIEKNGGIVVSPPPSQSPTVGQNGMSSPDDEYFRICKTGMLIADMDRDDSLNKTEFVRLLNRLTYSEFAGMGFSDLDPILQLAFYKIADSKYSVHSINVVGSKPGSSADRSTRLHLQAVCKSVRTALVTFDAMEAKPQGPVGIARPIAPPVGTPSPTSSPIGSSDLADCRTKLVESDANRNFLVGEDEFVGFAGSMTSNSFATFDELPILFRSSYGSAIGKGEAIDLGATNDYVLDDLCTKVISEGGEVTTADCLPSLYAADIDANGRLDEEEYVFFLELFGDISATDFGRLPYILRDNWEWIRLRNEFVDVSGITSDYGYDNLGEEIRLEYICSRSKDAVLRVFGGDDSTTLEEHCLGSLGIADDDANEFIDDEEFLSLVKVFSGAPMAGQYFGSLQHSFRDAFNNLEDPDIKMIDVETGVANGVCFELEMATFDSREPESFFEQCSKAASESDGNGDQLLDENEYITFLYSLAVAFGFSSTIPKDITFNDLSEVLQLNFEVLSKQGTTIHVAGALSPTSLTQEQFDNLRWVCQNTDDVVRLISSSEDSAITGYNSFIVSNDAGLGADDIRTGVERDGLNLAYIELVRDQVVLLKSKSQGRLKARKLKVEGVEESSIKIYSIQDTRCSLELPEESMCQVAFGSFNLLLANEPSPESISEQYSLTIQDAIDKGALQLKLLLASASTPLRVERSSTPLRPVDGGNFLSGGFDEPAPEPQEEEGSMFLTLVAGALVSLVLFGTGYYCFFYIKKRTKPDKKIDESETYYPPDRTEKSGSGVNEFSVEEMKPDYHGSTNSGGKQDAELVGIFSTSSSVQYSTSTRHRQSSNSSLESGSSELFRPSSQSKSKTSFDEPQMSGMTSLAQKPEKGPHGEDACQPPMPKGFVESESSFGDFEIDDSGNSSRSSSVSSNLLPVPNIEVVSEKKTPKAEERSTEPTLSSKQNTTNESDSESMSPDYLKTMKSSEGHASLNESTSGHKRDSPQRHDSKSSHASKPVKKKDSVATEDHEEMSFTGSFNSQQEDGLIGEKESEFGEEELIEMSQSSKDAMDEEIDSFRSNELSDEETLELEKSPSRSTIGEELIDDVIDDEGTHSVEEEVLGEEEVLDEHSDASFDEAETLVNSTMSMNSKDAYEAYQIYRPIVEDLVRQVVPDEIDNVDTMMEQFIGRERELIRTLKNMAGIEDSSGDEFDDEDSESFYSEGSNSNSHYSDEEQTISIEEDSFASQAS